MNDGSYIAAVIAAWLDHCWQLVRLTVVTQGNTLLAPVVGLLLCMPKLLLALDRIDRPGANPA
jgi:hypothetical protein